MTTSPSPPDLSGLSISSSQQSQGRLHDPVYDFDPIRQQAQQYNFIPNQGISAAAAQQYGALGPSPMKNRPSVRAGLPNAWMDSPGPGPLLDNRSLSPHNSSDFSSTGGSPPPMGHMINSLGGIGTPPIGLDDEVIPTAIVIKNIPFNVKKEMLLDIIASLSIPTPYAFNYHLDQSGAFRGLAFANFRQSVDADAVVAALNGFDVQGRKLRVEYKKVLQAGEKERIEREKALRRMRSMQMEKEHQIGGGPAPVGSPFEDYGTPMPPPPGFAQQRSFSSGMAYQNPTQGYSPPRLPTMGTLQQQYSAGAGQVPQVPTPSNSDAATASSKGGVGATELDMNDAATLEIYSRILLFKDDPMRDELAFSRQLTPKQRRVVHLVAQKLGVYHYSVGEGEERYAVVTRIDPNPAQPRTLSRAPSAYHLSQTAAQQQPMQNALRSKKSMPDMNALGRMTAPRLTTRISNGNMREGYATIASPHRRSSAALNALFGANAFGAGVAPPVPALPASVRDAGAVNGSGMGGMSGGLSQGESPTSAIMRQPKGPGATGFLNRRPSETHGNGGGLDARTHEPLEI